MTPAEATALAARCGIGLSDLTLETRGAAVHGFARFAASGGPLGVPGGKVPGGFAGWAPGRQTEFAAGRVLAAAALARFGAADYVPRSASRAPVWPAGLRGAITHYDEMAAVLVTDQPLACGIDITRVPPPGRTFDALVAAAVLEGDQATPDLPPRVAETLIFSAKETLYKALAPEVGRFFGFDAARCTRIGADQLTLELTGALSSALPGGLAFTCAWRGIGDAVETSLLAAR